MARRGWDELRRETLADPEARAAYEAAGARLDAAWEVACRGGCCVWWVLPEGDIGGVGVPGCPCERND